MNLHAPAVRWCGVIESNDFLWYQLAALSVYTAFHINVPKKRMAA
jgi:hypothetical protein